MGAFHCDLLANRRKYHGHRKSCKLLLAVEDYLIWWYKWLMLFRIRDHGIVVV